MKKLEYQAQDHDLDIPYGKVELRIFRSVKDFPDNAKKLTYSGFPDGNHSRIGQVMQQNLKIAEPQAFNTPICTLWFSTILPWLYR